MLVGLGHLTELKAALLPETMRAESDHNDLIASIGKGVAAQFDKHCNRHFPYLEDAEDIFSADRDHWYLNRAPVLAVTSIEQKDAESEGFIELTDVLQTSELTTGFLFFGGQLGPFYSRLRVTYNGGYWITDDDEEAEEMPEGGTVLPPDVKHAWLLQCRHVWDSIDVLGVSIAEKPKTFSALSELELIPAVKEKLAGHIRYVMS